MSFIQADLAAKVLRELTNRDCYQATKYISPKEVVRATRITFRRKIRKGEPVEVRFHWGRPNYLERRFIAACKKAGEPFPVRKIQFRPFPRSR